MQLSNVPVKFPTIWGQHAGGPFITEPVPIPSQIGVNPGRASWTDGFPPLNFTPVGGGGDPPFGQDFNGVTFQITAWCQWVQAGGPVVYDATFQAAGDVGGYPKGAIVMSATTFGKMWLNLVDNNTTNPDTGGANWRYFYYGQATDYYVDGGSVNALAITPQPPAGAYYDGMTFLVNPAHANTAASTLNVSGLGAKAVVDLVGDALLTGVIQVDQPMRVVYLLDLDKFVWINAPMYSTRPVNDNSKFLATTEYADRAAANAATGLDFYHGAIFGLQLSNTGGHLTTQVSVSAGACRDSTNQVAIQLNSPIAKDITANWAVGTGNGGNLDGTALAAGQGWWVHAIWNPTGPVVDVGFSQSPTAPPLPAGYTEFRRLGGIMLEAASTDVKQFIQTGDYFEFLVRSADYAATSNGGGVAYYRALSVPIGVPLLLDLYFQSTGTASTTAFLSGIFDARFGVPAAFGGPAQWAQIRRGSITDSSGAHLSYGTVVCRQWCDSAGKVYTFSSDTLDVIALGVVGWLDQRGKFF